MQIEEPWLCVKEPIWIHKPPKFLKGVIKDIYKDIITCSLESGDSLKLKKSDIFHRNPSATDPSQTDLLQIDIINEPEILQLLTVRFLNRKIYTYVENTLVAVNPYTPIPELYTKETKQEFIEHILSNSPLKETNPHVYSITAEMIRCLFGNMKSQAILISGESGAGKTETNKECLRFLIDCFGQLGGEKGKDKEKGSNIERTIMLANPILEAFGNSKTIRNNNSSRFGKYLSIMVDCQSKTIKNAEIFNYLLEKSRIISRSKEEQNFHIFYEFLAKTTPQEKQAYNLFDSITNKYMTYQDFTYTQNDNQIEYVGNADVDFNKIRESLVILPDKRSLDNLCRILSAVLHLGNLECEENEETDACEILPKHTFKVVCSLLEIEEKLLHDSLTCYNIKVGGEETLKCFSRRVVQELIHSLSKSLYERLFQWIINEINESTRVSEQDVSKMYTLGFLDIYGFEVLKSNSLEQMFINYTNERLHQIYLHKIFKLEKNYFEEEKLDHKWREIQFEDNIKVIELLDYSNLSIFNLLDEESAVASPDESSFIIKLRTNHKKHEKFPPANFNLLSTQFMIRHTPQDIQYNVIGFKEKNKDLLRDEIKVTMSLSKLPILQTMFAEEPKTEGNESKAHRIRKYLSSKFRKEMDELVNGLLNKSEQHFIRCIKSNGNKKPLEVEEEMVYSQIKYLGLLDTIKIKKMGYCIKIRYEEIDRKYSWFVRKSILIPAKNNEIVAEVKKFLARFGEDDMLFGVNKVFFKDYSYTVLMKKYAKYLELLNDRAHKITSLFVKINYQRKKERKQKHKKALFTYLKAFALTVLLNKKENNLKILQKRIREFLLYKSQTKKQESMLILQAYIKRNIETRNRIKKTEFLTIRTVYNWKLLLKRKKTQAAIVVSYIINKVLLERVDKDTKSKHINVISKYLNSFKVRIQRKDKIKQAMTNERNAIEGKSLYAIECYLWGFYDILHLELYKANVKKVQNNVRTYLALRKYKRLRSKIILIQRAVKEYLFMKKGAKEMFESTYQSYEFDILSKNEETQESLYDTESSHADEINGGIRKFLGKFKEKISLIYYVIDVELFIDIGLVYPGSSWVQNYSEVFQEGLEKNDPLQYISVGETFTVAANTNKMYLWGMHDSYRHISPESISQIKTKMAVEYFEINKNKLNFSYAKEDEKKAEPKVLKTFSTIAKDYILDNGKIYECLSKELIKGISSNERVLEISCGKAHTILRSSAKKVYTFGYGREGQLGHSSFNSEEIPRSIKVFENLKPFYPIQISASFTSSLVLLSNRKLYWFGKNGTLSEVSTPTIFELKSKCEFLNNNDFCIARTLTTWSRTMSITGITLACFNGRFENNLSLRNKTIDVLFSKWQDAGIFNVNPPLIPSVSDHFEQCHVKLKNKKINIYPSSKTTLKEMEEKAKSFSSLASFDNPANRNSIGTEFSFANTQKNSIFK